MKSRYWTIIVYPDSVNPKWKEILKDKGCKVAISPLHDSDLRENGEIKKSHYHLLLIMNGGRTKEYIKTEIVEPINRLEQFQNVIDKEKAFEYLYHANDMDKYQYKKEDIEYINSNVSDYLNTDYITILEYIDDNKIKTLVGLLKALRKDNNKRLIKYTSDNTYFVQSYLKEVREGYEEKLQQVVKLLQYNYKEVYMNKDVLNKLCEVFDNVKITQDEI